MLLGRGCAATTVQLQAAGALGNSDYGPAAHIPLKQLWNFDFQLFGSLFPVRVETKFMEVHDKA
eukprot:2848685-Amphidinium_carterae.2